MNETGWRTSECPKKLPIVCVWNFPHILKRDTNFRKAIKVRHRVAITLYWLADTHIIERSQTSLVLGNLLFVVL